MQYVNNQWGSFFSYCFTVSLCGTANSPNFLYMKGIFNLALKRHTKRGLASRKGESCLLQSGSRPLQHRWSVISDRFPWLPLGVSLRAFPTTDCHSSCLILSL